MFTLSMTLQNFIQPIGTADDDYLGVNFPLFRCRKPWFFGAIR